MTVHLIHSEDCTLASKSAAAFAASNVSAVPLAIRSSRLLPALALRLTSHVDTPSCVNTNNISSPTSVQTPTPIVTRHCAKSATSGSRAALRMTVVPVANTAASSKFSVAPTEGCGRTTSAPLNPRGAVARIVPPSGTRWRALPHPMCREHCVGRPDAASGVPIPLGAIQRSSPR
jgi:hypothetical protein